MTTISSDVGAHFIIEPLSTSLSREEATKISRLKPSGVMLRKRNFLAGEYNEWLPPYKKLIDDLRAAAGRTSLIVSIDHEGGRVIRPPEPFTRFPYAAHWGTKGEAVGRAMGIELKSLGINVSFSPCADISSNPENPVINERAFGRTAHEAIRGIIPFAEAMEREGVKACAKHFPGHGDTSSDSHWGLPSLPFTLDEMRQRELLPFKALVEWGIGAVMTAHILFPAVDKEIPATFSKALLTDVLRKEMKFDGVTIADALGMEAVRPLLSDPKTMERGINAGLDLMLVVGDAVTLDDALALATTLEKSRLGGGVAKNAFQESTRRINEWLDQLPLHEVKPLPAAVFNAHKTLAEELSEQKPWSSFNLDLPGFE